jgi:hypothetical protein
MDASVVPSNFTLLPFSRYSNLRSVESEPLKPGTTGVYTSPWIEPARRITLWLFLATLALALPGLLINGAIPSWLIATVLIAATLTTVISLLRTLPLLNVITAFVLTGLIGALAEFGALHAGFPSLSGAQFHDFTRPILQHPVVALVWIITLFSSRGSARFILHRAGRKGAHGFRVIGLTSVLTMLFATGVQSVARPSEEPDRTTAQLIYAALWGVVAIITLIITTPWLINKKPSPEPPDPHPLIVWSSLLALFVVAAVVRAS